MGEPTAGVVAVADGDDGIGQGCQAVEHNFVVGAKVGRKTGNHGGIGVENRFVNGSQCDFNIVHNQLSSAAANASFLQV